MSSQAADLARSFDDDVFGRYARHFVDLLVHTLDKPAYPTQALDLDCGNGFAAVEMIKVLPPGSRVVAISDDRPSLKQLHERLSVEARQVIYPRKEGPNRLPFAPSTFDLAWACLPTRVLTPLKSVIRQALRCLRPGGMLAFCAPTRGSFIELINAYATLDPSAIQQVVADRAVLMDHSEWIDLLTRCGAVEAGAAKATIQLVVTPPLSRDRLIAQHLLPVWLGKEPGDADTNARLDKILTGRTPVTIEIGCIHARRGLDEIEDSTVG